MAGLFKRNGKARTASPKRCPRRCSAISSPWRRSFCVSGLGIIGSMREGLTGECSSCSSRACSICSRPCSFRRASAVWWACWPFPQCAIQFALLFKYHDAHAVHHADHVCGFLRLRRHHHVFGAGLRQMGLCRSLSSVCCPVCFRHAAVRIMEADYVDENRTRGFTGSPSSRMGKAVLRGKAHQALGVAVKKKRGKRKMISPLPCFG